VSYRGETIYKLPPNGNNMAALEMLNIMQHSKANPNGPYGPAELHTRIEALLGHNLLIGGLKLPHFIRGPDGHADVIGPDGPDSSNEYIFFT
jgi:hypothetical protein